MVKLFWLALIYALENNAYIHIEIVFLGIKSAKDYSYHSSAGFSFTDFVTGNRKNIVFPGLGLLSL